VAAILAVVVITPPAIIVLTVLKVVVPALLKVAVLVPTILVLTAGVVTQVVVTQVVVTQVIILLVVVAVDPIRIIEMLLFKEILLSLHCQEEQMKSRVPLKRKPHSLPIPLLILAIVPSDQLLLLWDD